MGGAIKVHVRHGIEGTQSADMLAVANNVQERGQGVGTYKGKGVGRVSSGFWGALVVHELCQIWDRGCSGRPERGEGVPGACCEGCLVAKEEPLIGGAVLFLGEHSTAQAGELEFPSGGLVLNPFEKEWQAVRSGSGDDSRGRYARFVSVVLGCNPIAEWSSIYYRFGPSGRGAEEQGDCCGDFLGL